MASQRDVGDGTEGERCEHSRSGLGEVLVREETGTGRTGAGGESWGAARDGLVWEQLGNEIRDGLGMARGIRQGWFESSRRMKPGMVWELPGNKNRDGLGAVRG